MYFSAHSAFAHVRGVLTHSPINHDELLLTKPLLARRSTAKAGAKNLTILTCKPFSYYQPYELINCTDCMAHPHSHTHLTHNL
jgi:hypothetical protein